MIKQYKFKTVGEMYDMVKDMGHDLEKEDPQPIYNISRTPIESIWPGELDYADDPFKTARYQSIGFGPDVSTPWGPLPHVIMLLRKDIAEKLEVGYKEPPIAAPVVAEKKFTLFPPGWKPAPGFVDPREEKDRPDRVKHYWEK